MGIGKSINKVGLGIGKKVTLGKSTQIAGAFLNLKGKQTVRMFQNMGKAARGQDVQAKSDLKEKFTTFKEEKVDEINTLKTDRAKKLDKLNAIDGSKNGLNKKASDLKEYLTILGGKGNTGDKISIAKEKFKLSSDAKFSDKLIATGNIYGIDIGGQNNKRQELRTELGKFIDATFKQNLDTNEIKGIQEKFLNKNEVLLHRLVNGANEIFGDDEEKTKTNYKADGHIRTMDTLEMAGLVTRDKTADGKRKYTLKNPSTLDGKVKSADQVYGEQESEKITLKRVYDFGNEARKSKEEKEAEAATTIQAVFRGNQGRVEAKEAKEEVIRVENIVNQALLEALQETAPTQLQVQQKGISASSEISAQAQKDMHVVPFDETNADRRAKAKAELEARNILFKNNKEARELEARISEANDYLPTDNTSQILLLTDRLHVEMERINKNLAAFNQFSKESSTIDVSDTIKALDLATTTAPATQNQNNEDKLYGLDILEQNRENNGITDKFMKVDFNQPLTPLTPLTKEGLALLTEKSTLTAVSKRTNKEIFKDANDKQKAAALAKKKLEQYRKQTNDTMADNQEQTLRELEKEVLRTEKEAITADAEANRLVQQHLADSAKAEPATTEPQAQQKVIPATAEPTTTATTQNQNNEYKLYGLQVLERSEGSEGSEGSKGSLEFSSDGSVQSDVTEKADNLSQSRPTLWSATKGFGNTIKDTMLARVLPQRK